jgi:hypothetical protein
MPALTKSNSVPQSHAVECARILGLVVPGLPETRHRGAGRVTYAGTHGLGRSGLFTEADWCFRKYRLVLVTAEGGLCAMRGAGRHRRVFLDLTQALPSLLDLSPFSIIGRVIVFRSELNHTLHLVPVMDTGLY